jgi:4-hydroxymandelate synthase
MLAFRLAGVFMAVRNIQYIELYTSDKQSIVDFFTLSMGFLHVAESTDNEKNSALLRQGQVQLLVTAGPGTYQFLDAHGDGIADIALACDDVAVSRNAAAEAGARVVDSVQGGTAVSGLGGLRHTLVPVSEPRTPAGRAWVSAQTSPARPEGKIRLLDHVAICLERGTLTDYADFYRDSFGLSKYSTEYVDIGDQAMDVIVVRNSSGGITFNLIAPDHSTNSGQLDAFLARNGGPGVQHLAFLVEDIVPAVREFRDRGVEFLSTPDSYYESLTRRLPGLLADVAELRAAHVLADRDEWGYLLQLFTRSPHERNTLFYELIQRRGARGFGSANIRALYEAVERDRLATE